MLSILLAMADSPEDKRKIELLYEEYHKLMYAHAYNMVENVHDAEDIELQSWEKIIRNIHIFKKVSSNETKKLILTVVERTTIDFCRKKWKIQKVEQLISQLDLETYVETNDENIENVELCESLNKLPKKFRDVLILHYVNELSAKEIAELLGISEDTVWQRLHRGRLHLKEMKHDGIF